jgi:hypothetical protein
MQIGLREWALFAMTRASHDDSQSQETVLSIHLSGVSFSIGFASFLSMDSSIFALIIILSIIIDAIRRAITDRSSNWIEALEKLATVNLESQPTGHVQDLTSRIYIPFFCLQASRPRPRFHT